MRIVCDTNVLVSIALGKSETIKAIRTGWRIGAFQLFVSNELLAEFESVAHRPKLQRRFQEGEVETQIAEFLTFSEHVVLQIPYPEAPDPKDAFLLALARDGKADVLVTGDKALLALETFAGTAILSPRAFVERLEEQGYGQ